MYTTAVAFFEALWEAGITHVFVNLGSDHPGILEAMLEGESEYPERFPKIYTCPHEFVALSAADGFSRLTSRPSAVLVHVDVGTQNLACALHNASNGRVPILIFAGLSPFTQEGELRGSRSEFIHWLQDVPDQKSIVGGYCRWTGEVRSGRNVKKVVWRALQFAGGSRAGDRNEGGTGGSNGGPVYLMGAREVMEEEIPEEWRVKGTEKELKKWHPVKSSVLPAEAISEIAEALCSANKPLIVIGYTGRNHASPAELVKLADTVKGVRVFDSGASEMSFPASHPAFLGSKAGPEASEAIKTADVILVLDCDVPWMHTQCHPNEDATIFHVDKDPLKERMSLFYIEAQARYQADTYLVLKQLNASLESDPRAKERLSSPTRNSRYNEILSAHSARMARIDQISTPPTDPDSPITVPVLVRLLRNALPEDTIFVSECVTGTANVVEQIRPILPGSWLTGGGGGLGWSGGAAVGVKLASDHASGGPGKGKMVVQFVGDGSFLFSAPSSVYWVAMRYDIPIFTVVLNNGGWRAPRVSASYVHPQGRAQTATMQQLHTSFEPSPDYGMVAKGAAGGRLWTKKVRTVAELKGVMGEGIEKVKGGMSAVLDAVVS